MNKHVLALMLLLLVAAPLIQAAEDCDNEDPPVCCPDDPDCEGGENKFNLFTGNISRQVPDLRLAVQIGEYPMEFSRTMTSRPEFTERPRDDYPFGQAGNWRHRYQWTILDDGVATNGERKIQIIYPDSRVEFYHKKSTNDLFMTYLPRTPSRVLPVGTNYYLYTDDGTRHHFTENTNGLAYTYTMQSISDPFSNVYRFAYGTNGLLSVVHGPNTNHHFRLTYATVTNSVNSGLIRFTFDNDIATNVLLAGTFNNWNGSVNPMVYTNGEWIADVTLEKGTYAYKFYATFPGGTNQWITDPDNPLSGGPDNNSIAVIDPFRLISRVDASDGRFVTYTYGWSYSTATNVNNNAIDVLLTSVEYGDGTSAAYTYYPATYDQERKTLPKTAFDPMLNGPGRAVMYTYRTNTPYSGKVSEEFSLITTQSFGRMYNDPADPNRHIYVDSSGQTNVLSYHGYTANLMTSSNALGYVTRREYADAYDPPGDNDQQGVLWKEVDPLGRTTVYSRTTHFGAILTVSNANGSCSCGDVDIVNTYTDTNYPFYLSAKYQIGGLTTTYARDAFHRPTRIDYPDGTYETNAYNAHGQIIASRKRDGSQWTWTYDSRGRKTVETDPLGHTTRFGYDTKDRLAAVTNALGHATRFYYNWRGMVTNTTYADGSAEVIWYNDYGMETQRLGRAGGITVRRYDALGHLSAVIDPEGATNIYVYDVAGRLRSMTTPLGLVVSNTYDAINRKLRETFSLDNTFNEWRYDPDGIRTQVNRLGGTNLFIYTSDRKVRASRDANGHWTSYGYDEAGNRTHVTNALGDVVVYRYDAAGRQVSMTDCSGATVSNSYDGLGRLIRQVDANGVVSSNRYDGAGRLLASWRGGLLVSSNTYNAVDWLVSSTDASGMATSNTYDSAGRQLRTYMPDGSYFENVYSNRFLVKRIDRAGRTTTYQRDLVGRITNEVDHAGQSIRYRYDASGNLTDLFDQNNAQTRFLYDQESRQTGKVYADGVTNRYFYDALGRLTNKVDGKSVATSYRFDAVGNITRIDYAADADVIFAYDALGRTVQMIDGVGTTLYAYAGSCGWVSSEDGPFSNDTVSYGYDVGKRLVAITSSSSVVVYQLDALGRMTSVITRVGLGAPATNSYQYIAQGLRIDALRYGNGILTDYAYDPLLRLTNLSHQSSGTNFATYSYAYNAADLRTSVVIGGATPAARTIAYGYDAVGQLTSAHGDFPGYRFEYAYDPAGNPTRQDQNGFISSNAYNILNQGVTSRWSGAVSVLGLVNFTNGLVSVNGNAASVREGGIPSAPHFAATNLAVASGTNLFTAVHTDPFGRAATGSVSVVARNRGYGYDANGNMTNDGQFAYVWDNADRLVQVRSLASSQVVMTCAYDGLGRRRVRTLASGAEGGPSTNRYVYHQWLVLEVRDGSMNVLESYAHGPDLSGTLGGAGGIGGILNCSSGTVSHVFHYDANGNVVRVTSSDRTVVAALEYGPFGSVLYRSGSFTPRYQFSSKEYDAAVGLNYYGYRYYSPQLGRWLNRDPIEERGGLNVHSFVKNNTLNQTDPLGMSIFNNLPAPIKGPYPAPWPIVKLCGVAGYAGSLCFKKPGLDECLEDALGEYEECLAGCNCRNPNYEACVNACEDEYHDDIVACTLDFIDPF